MLFYGRDKSTAGPFPRLIDDFETRILDRWESIGIYDAIGDLNGDGVDDLAFLSSPPYWAEQRQQIKILFGTTPDRPFPALAQLDDLMRDFGGFRITSPGHGLAAFANPVSAGDFNGDGRSDIMFSRSVGSELEAFVVFGRPESEPWPIEFDVVNAAPSEAVRLAGWVGTGTGRRGHGGVGDVNGDGVDDVAITKNRLCHVVFGRKDSFRDPFPSDINLEALDGSSGVVLIGAYGRQAISFMHHQKLGDINSDGADDLLFLDRIVFGRPHRDFPARINVADLGDREKLLFAADENMFLRALGDVNRDGIGDFSMTGVNFGSTCAIAAIVYGRRPPPPCRADLDRDGVATMFDCLAFNMAWQDGDRVADLDQDGFFTLHDYLLF